MRKSNYFNLFLLLGAVLLIGGVVVHPFFAFIFYLHLLVYFLFLTLQKIAVLIFLLTFGIVIGSLAILDEIRSLFPKTMVGEVGAVGASQYTGYPLYFDYVFLFYFLFLPAFSLMIFIMLNKKR